MYVCLFVCSDDDKRNKVDFNDIVERDTTYYEQHSSQLFIGSLIESLPFRIGVLLAIVMNSIVVGLQTNKYLVWDTFPVSYSRFLET